VPPAAMPYRTALTFTYDCGEFEAVMDKALKQADAEGFDARRVASAQRGRLRGRGVANAIERAASPPSLEYGEVRFDPGGTATLHVGTSSQGQGHETLYRQIACTRLGLAPEAVRVVEGDTEAVAYGAGSFGSRSAALGGTALWLAADKVIAKGRLIAAHLLEAGEADLEFVDGRFRVAGTDRAVALAEVARAAYLPARLPKDLAPGLIESATFTPGAETFPNGCHVCEVEVDPETGAVRVDRYHVVDDVGTEINPLTLKGQVMGGVVQGLGQVLMERMAYDAESGQLLTASFMDYALPRADDVCALEIGGHPVPTRLNPLGAKGAGEAGTVGALAAVMNAVADALAARGAAAPDMPASPERVWRALQPART